MTLADVVQIKPHEFNKPSSRAIEDWINEKYADKVLQNIGLCVGFHSLVKASEGLIGHGDGIVNVNVDFRLIVFRPFKGEIITATITSSDPNEGIFLSTEFFDDIQVPPSVLPDGSAYDTGEDVFIWQYHEDGQSDGVPYFFDRAETCLLRIEAEQWHDQSPTQQSGSESSEKENGESRAALLRKAPYSLQASMMHSGTGPKLWWVPEEQQNGEHDAASPPPPR